MLRLFTLLGSVCLLGGQVQAAPDIVVFLADDLGSTDIGPERRKPGLLTPNIDKLGAAGVVYTAGYAAPVCIQARTMLLSGKWQQRKSVGAVTNNGPQPPSSVVMLPERLRALGYQTAMIGKWHLGMSSGKHPLDQGFDTFFGFPGAPPNYFGPDPDVPLIRQRSTKVVNTNWVTDTFGTEAVNILKAPRSRPLFLLVAWSATHDPLQGTLASVLQKMDANIGRVVAAAKPGTLLIFAGDNGRFSNAPFRGKKYDIWEGGVRVPFVMRWDGRLKPGQRINTPASLIDIAATSLAAAGTTLSDTDGFDLLAPLPANRPVFFKAMYDDPGVAVRRGPWKLYLDHKGIATALYDVLADKGESVNVASKNPKVVAELTALLTGFKAALSK